MELTKFEFNNFKEDWKKTINDDCEDGEIGNRWPVFTAHWQTREALWVMCRILGISVLDGTPGHACRILDRFLSTKCKAYFKRKLRPNQSILVKWENFQEGVVESMPLILLTCLRIAAKSLHGTIYAQTLCASAIVSFLKKQGCHYTEAYVNNFEAEILMVINFRIPLWSSLQVAMFLCHLIGKNFDVTSMMSFAELCRSSIEAKVRQTEAIGKNGRLYLRTLPLCAGVVSAVARMMSQTDVRQLNKELALLTKLPEEFIKCIADAVLIIFFD